MPHFYKYQATGNDFILMDNREGNLSLSVDQISRICDRRFGIGADGLILIEKDSTSDFRMVYYNSDGSQSLCGNGCRSAIDLASRLGLVNTSTTFSAYDGLHDATLLDGGLIRLHMNDVQDYKQMGEDYFIHTGSPHYVRFVKNLSDYPVVAEGRKIRYDDAFLPAGTNVNFVEILDDKSVFVRTYERGVEDETLSCGTGVTAVALAAGLKGFQSPVQIKVMGGMLSVEFRKQPENQVSSQPVTKGPLFGDIFLIGPAKMVFEGDLDL